MGGIILDRKEISFFYKNRYLKFPKILQIEITNRCPLKCPQCYKNIENIKDIKFSLLEHILRECAPLGLRNIMINGGEPLIYPHFFELLDLLSELQISSNCFISGFGVTDGIVQRLRNYNISVNISLNGSTEKINSYSRDGFHYAIQALRIFRDHGMHYGINWVARSDNVDDFENILILAEQYNADSVLILGNKMTHKGKVEAPLSREGLELLISKIKKYELSNGSVTIEKQRCFTELCALYYNTGSSVYLGCPAGVILCTMDLQGRFYPCSHLNYPENYPSVYEYWHNSKILHNLRMCNITESIPCVDCLYAAGCRFCKAESLLTHDDFNAGNRNCNIFQRKEVDYAE